MADELSEDERAIVAKHREKAAAERTAADADLRVWLRNSDGAEAEVPYGKGRGWLQKNFGIDLDEEPVQDEPDEPKGKTLKAVPDGDHKSPAFRSRRSG